MKPQSKSSQKATSSGNMETPANNPQLHHFLSPLELAMYRHKFSAFTYYIDGEAIHIEPFMVRDIVQRSRWHVSTLRAVLQRARQKQLKQNPELRHFLNRTLQQHGLPTRVYHVLKGNGCHNMAEVANRGEDKLRQMRGMGKMGLRAIIKLFNDNGCGSLFL